FGVLCTVHRIATVVAKGNPVVAGGLAVDIGRVVRARHAVIGTHARLVRAAATAAATAATAASTGIGVVTTATAAAAAAAATATVAVVARVVAVTAAKEKGNGAGER